MCLVTKQPTPIVCTQDIEVFKVLVPSNGHLYSPYRDFYYPLNKVLADKSKEDIHSCFGYYLIESGYFHSCVDLEGAKLLQFKLLHAMKIKSKIYKGIIPKGTPIYYGEQKDICSKSLKVIEECFD